MQGVSTLFRFVFRLFLRFAQRHGLLESLTDFIQALFIEVMYTLGTFGVEVDQLVVLAHGVQYIASVKYKCRVCRQGCTNNEA